MSFVSFAFLALLALACAGRLVLGRTRREAVYLLLLLASSLLFYGWHVPAYLAILLASTCVDYLAGGVIAALPVGTPRRKALLLLSLATNLGLLGTFKYFNFGRDSLAWLLAGLQLDAGWLPRLDLILPIGISFYTFQSMSYTIDIYRGQLQPVRSFWKFLLFVSFFPQLVAGPIVRASEFLYQLDRRRPPRLGAWLEGGYLIVRGFFLKMVLADNLAPVVDRFWPLISQPGANAVDAVAVAFLFSCQIFCDFAGYSSIARGTAYLLGFRLPLNFNSPYIAGSFKNFWQRWHMTLSRWLRDYLYVSLGGNRISARRTYANLMLVMLLGGLWHGAAWTFVVWGGLHGAALAVERLLGLERAHEKLKVPLRIAWFLVVQAVVLISWVFFRSGGVGEALAIVGNFFQISWASEYPEPLWALTFAAPVVMMHLATFLKERFPRLRDDTGGARAMLAGVMIYLIITCYGTSNAFIYFQF